MIARALCLTLIVACGVEAPSRTIVIPNDDPASRFSYYELERRPTDVIITGYDAGGARLRAMTAALPAEIHGAIARESLCADCGECATAMTRCYTGGSIEACSEDRMAWKLACGYD